MNIELQNILEAYESLKPIIRATPLYRNNWLSDYYGCEVFLKLENMHPIGSFKIRGATYKILSLTEQEKQKGVIAASAGNHAQGVAWGAKRAGVSALIVMPKNAPITKIQNTRALGAEVIFEGETYDDAYDKAMALSHSLGRTYIHAFADPKIIAGQGTALLEIMDQVQDFDYFVCAIGGGGLLAGSAVALQSKSTPTQIIGVQAQGAPSMAESIKLGKPIKLESVQTFADGIAIKTVNPHLFNIIKEKVHQVVTVDDEAISKAILILLEKGKTVAEGAGATALAGLEPIKEQIKGKKVVVMVSGGNIDVNLLGRIIDRGLITTGRRIRINATISDKPGSLARLTNLIAAEGASVIQAIHDRNEPSTRLDHTEVALTLETRGSDHAEVLIERLREQVYKLEVVR